MNKYQYLDHILKVKGYSNVELLNRPFEHFYRIMLSNFMILGIQELSVSS